MGCIICHISNKLRNISQIACTISVQRQCDITGMTICKGYTIIQRTYQTTIRNDAAMFAVSTLQPVNVAVASDVPLFFSM